MKFINEETALFPVLRYYYKNATEVAKVINRSQNYVAQRMSRTSGKSFSSNEMDMLIKAIITENGDHLVVGDRNRKILFSDKFNPEEKSKLLFVHEYSFKALVED